jgi:hypothetical protein
MIAVTVWYNGNSHRVFGQSLTAARVLQIMTRDMHPDVAKDYGLFTMGMTEIHPDAGLAHGAEVFLRPRVLH